MADGKKSFLLYTDLDAVVSKLSHEDAGILFKHILAYVNDRDPETDNILVQIAFEPVKQNLKRSLKKWEAERSKRAEAGKLGGIKSGESRRNKANRSNASKNEANEAVNVNVNVNDILLNKENEGVLQFASQPQPEETPAPLPTQAVWNKKPSAGQPLDLPEIKANSVIELLRFTKNVKATLEQVYGLWNVFKTQSFNGDNFYETPSQAISHFFNWIKYQPIAELNKGMATATKSMEQLRREMHEKEEQKRTEAWR